MRPARSFTRCINNLLILPVLLQVLLPLILCASALGLQRSLLLVGTALTQKHEAPKDPPQYANNSLITRSGKSNKVSKLLRLIHNKAEDAVYHRKAGQHEADKGEESLDLAPIDSNLTDDKVITSACNKAPSRTCKYAVMAALKAGLRERKMIANALRQRPAHVEASKLLYHKLFEYSIAKTEEKNIDEKIDLGINLIATKSPYGWIATKALDLTSKKS